MLLKSLGLGELPKNSLLLVEEDLGGVKSIFLQSLVLEALKIGQRTLYISTIGSVDDVLEEIELKGSRQGSEMKNLILDGDVKTRESLIEILKSLSEENDTKAINLVIVDTFSYLFLEVTMHDLIDSLNLFKKTCRQSNITIYLASDVGVLHEREESILRSMTDGIIQFRTEYLAGKVNKFINIPKMRGVPPIERLIPYKIKEGIISPDVRERVG